MKSRINMQKQRNISIQLIRILAMFLIFFDHMLNFVSFPMRTAIVQMANSGVFIFLFISGFLFGNRHINNWKQWFLKRFTRICIPLWIFMSVDFFVEYVIWNVFDIKLVLIYALNLQGIFGVNIGGMNLWFLTLIMICYILTPLLQWVKQEKMGKNVGISILLIGVLVQILLAYATDIGMVANHTLSWCVLAVGMYIAGYFVGDRILSDKTDSRQIAGVTVLALISTVAVLVCHQWFDGQVIYDRIVIYYGMIMLDLWICMAVRKMEQHINRERIKCILSHLDTISYEFYIVHGLVIVTVAVRLLWNFGTVPYILSALVLSWIAAVVLHRICERIYNVLNTIKHNKF